MLESSIYYTIGSGGTIPPDPDPNFDTLNQYEQMYDVVWYAKGGLTSSNAQATEGQAVATIPAKKGGNNMIYSGVAAPAVIGSSPKLYGLGVRSENVPNIPFLTNTYATKAFPFEATFIGISHPTQDYEAKNNTFQSDTYIGYGGGNTRVGENNATISGSGVSPLFKVCVEHVLFEATQSTLWRDGVLIGTAPRTSRASRKTLSSWFTDTNNFAWDCFAMYERYGKFSDSDRNSILTSLGTKWNQGLEVQSPYAYNIVETYNSGTQTWSVTFASKNLSGSGIAATRYRWYLNKRATGQGDFGDQTLVGTSATLPKSAYASLVSGFNGVYYLKCYIQVEDSQGKTHGYMSSAGYASE